MLSSNLFTHRRVGGKAKDGVVENSKNIKLHRDVSRFSQVLLTLSIVSSFMYWSSLALPISGWLHAVIKWLSIGTLGCIVLRFLSCKQDIFLLFAMFFHSLGDLVLAHPYQDLLLYSLGPFLLGHIFYILTFKADVPANVQAIKKTFSRAKAILIAASMIYSAIMGSILLPSLLNSHLFVPVIVYILIISSMVILSVIPQYKSRMMTLGCWMYILSDSLIAMDKFYAPLPPTLDACTWPLYYIGQILISLGLMKEKKMLMFMYSSDRISF